jgi:hypothetical protein
MNLATIEIPVEEAKERLAEYEAALRQDRNAEDEAMAAAYRAAARGLPTIRLSEAVTAGGWFEDGLPRIAVVRADATQCWVDVCVWNQPGQVVFAATRDADNRGALVGRHTVRVPAPSPAKRHTRARTVVPMIPPRFRPKPRRLQHCHILWEVESWTPEPPKDPALLRHIRGDLWSVLAVWDLSELERAVLAQRATS